MFHGFQNHGKAVASFTAVNLVFIKALSARGAAVQFIRRGVTANVTSWASPLF